MARPCTSFHPQRLLTSHIEKPICSVNEATEKDVDIAVSAARKAFEGQWQKTVPQERSKLLTKLSDLFDQHAKQIAAIESLDNGKSLTMAMADVGYASGTLRYYGGWADKIHGKTVDTGPDSFNYVKQEPVRPFFSLICKPNH